MTGPQLRPPPLIAFCGGMCLVFGLVLAYLSDQIPGLGWYAVPIAVLGFALVLIYRRARRETQAEGPVEIKPPGKWFLFAIMAIWCGLLLYIFIAVKAK
ncbi:hypothetical protein BH11PLA2_BH11PLA2_42500 [soil metagenome]